MFEQIKWDERGLVPAIVQDIDTKQVLMMAYMSAESLQQTIETGETVFWSRSRSALWHKGATSGNTQKVREIYADCDGDTLLVLVEPAGPACHTGAVSCFFEVLSNKNCIGEKLLPHSDLGIITRANGQIANLSGRKIGNFRRASRNSRTLRTIAAEFAKGVLPL